MPSESPETASAWATRMDSGSSKESKKGRFPLLAEKNSAPDGTARPSGWSGSHLAFLLSGVLVSMLAGIAMAMFHIELGLGRTAAVRVAAGVLTVSLVVLFIGLYRILLRSKVDQVPAIDQVVVSELVLREYFAAAAHRTRSSWVVIISMYLFWLMLTGGVFVAIILPSEAITPGGLVLGVVATGATLFIRSAAMRAYRLADEASRRATRACILAVQKETGSDATHPLPIPKTDTNKR